MRAPRLSIIPARAATDPELKPRDLQVLCVLGRHTDELGWCRRSQVKMAREMDCARSTVQAAIGRLTRQGYLEQFHQETDSGRDSSHLYRVILDPVHEDVSTVQLVDTDRDDDVALRETSSKLACRSVGTPADISAPPAGPESAPPAGPESAPPAGPESAPMLTTPLNDPLLIEREGARERDEESAGLPAVKHLPAAKANRIFNSLVEGWPGNRGSSLRNAIREFEKLTPDEQLEALERRDDWIALLRSQSKDHFPAPSSYLAEKLWMEAPKDFGKAEQGGEVEAAPPFGKAWGAVRLAKLLQEPKGPPPKLTMTQERLVANGLYSRDELLREKRAKEGWPQVNTMHERAVQRHLGVQADPSLAPLLELFGKVANGSNLWQAWKVLHAERGWPWFGEDRDCPDWVWMPTTTDPPGVHSSNLEAVRAAMARFETEYETNTRKQAAE